MLEADRLNALDLAHLLGLAGAGSVMLTDAWPSYHVMRAWLALRRRLPWNLMAFLDDMHHLQVLRRVGAVYQFRHALLQDRLVGPGARRRGG